MKKLLQVGAEAKVYRINDSVIKDRIQKTYRHPKLDEKIRKSRTKREEKILKKAHDLKVNVPEIISSEKYQLKIEFIPGDKLSTSLNTYPKEKQYKTLINLGKQVALLHKNNIIHGDLTTSNVILSKDEIFIIDFGLGFISSKIEDQAVDLHLIKQALEAKHFQNHEELFNHFLKGYKWQKSSPILERLKIVERRGRYKH